MAKMTKGKPKPRMFKVKCPACKEVFKLDFGDITIEQMECTKCGKEHDVLVVACRECDFEYMEYFCDNE